MAVDEKLNAITKDMIQMLRGRLSMGVNGRRRKVRERAYCALTTLTSKMPYTDQMTSLESIYQSLEAQTERPLDQWSPPLSGEMDLTIDVNGHWFHEGEAITRAPLVNLFASILWHQDHAYFLMTPVEKWRISVQDVPFIAQSARQIDGRWKIQTNVGDTVIIDADHPVELRRFANQWIPYVNVRFDLWARLSRGVYIQWVECALEESGDQNELVLNSGGYAFAVARSDG